MVDAGCAVVLDDVAAVLLDMDGTLLESEHASGACWVEWAGRRGKDPDAVLAVVRGRKAGDSMRELAPELTPDDLAADLAAFAVAEEQHTEGVEALDGAADLLADLVARDVPHALVTSAGDRLSTIRMGAAGLTRPAVVVHGAEVARSKPDPEGFLTAAARLGVDPARCVVLEDSPAGVAAARAAGMRVVGVGEVARALDADVWVPTPAAVRVMTAPGTGTTLTVG